MTDKAHNIPSHLLPDGEAILGSGEPQESRSNGGLRDFGDVVEVVDTPELDGVDRVVIYGEGNPTAVPYTVKGGEYRNEYNLSDLSAFVRLVRKKASTCDLDFFAGIWESMDSDSP